MLQSCLIGANPSQRGRALTSSPDRVALSVPTNAKIGDLHPTQMTVGYREVAKKRRHWREARNGSVQRMLRRRVVPIVLGPNANCYLLDRHHWLCALLAEGVADVPVLVLADLQDMDQATFWSDLNGVGGAIHMTLKAIAKTIPKFRPRWQGYRMTRFAASQAPCDVPVDMPRTRRFSANLRGLIFCAATCVPRTWTTTSTRRSKPHLFCPGRHRVAGRRAVQMGAEVMGRSVGFVASEQLWSRGRPPTTQSREHINAATIFGAPADHHRAWL